MKQSFFLIFPKCIHLTFILHNMLYLQNGDKHRQINIFFSLIFLFKFKYLFYVFIIIGVVIVIVICGLYVVHLVFNTVYYDDLCVYSHFVEKNRKNIHTFGWLSLSCIFLDLTTEFSLQTKYDIYIVCVVFIRFDVKQRIQHLISVE